MSFVRIYTSLGYLAVYLAAIEVGRTAVLGSSGLALFWPAAGVSALWLLRGTTRREVVLDVTLLFAGTAIFFLAVGVPLVTALVFGVANTVQGLGVRAFQAWRRRLPLTGPMTPEVSTSRDLLGLLAAALVASLLSAPLGMAGLWLHTQQASWVTALGWVVRNSCGTFVVTAVVLTFVSARRAGSLRITTEHRPYAWLELLVAGVVTAVSGVLVFSAPQQRPIAYVMIVTSVWIGFRFSPVVGALHTTGFGLLAISCTLAGWGPFGAVSDLAARAIAVQVFVAISATIVLMLSFGAAERSALTERLRASEARARGRADLVDAVTRVMIDGLFVVDSSETVLLSNPAATAMAGVGPSASQVGSPEHHGLFYPDGTVLAPEDLPRARALRGELVTPMDLLRIDPQSGQQRMLSVSAVPVRLDDADAPAVAVLALRDVTKVRAQSRELEHFAGVVAHDLKTPLTGVISWAEILDDQLDEPDLDVDALRASLDRVRGSADRMNALITDLLAYSQTQNAVLSPEPVSLDLMVDQIARDLRDTHREEIPVVEHDALGHVLADPTLVRQLLTNLIGNAVKYVAPGVVPHLTLSAAPVDGMLEVWVTDNGIGIPDQDLGRVFDSFFRAASTLDYPGTGLGLAICAHTVERHGGRISARKGFGGQGTSMIFTLPLATDPVTDPATDLVSEQPEAQPAEPAVPARDSVSVSS